MSQPLPTSNAAPAPAAPASPASPHKVSVYPIVTPQINKSGAACGLNNPSAFFSMLPDSRTVFKCPSCFRLDMCTSDEVAGAVAKGLPLLCAECSVGRCAASGCGWTSSIRGRKCAMCENYFCLFHVMRASPICTIDSKWAHTKFALTDYFCQVCVETLTRDKVLGEYATAAMHQMKGQVEVGKLTHRDNPASLHAIFTPAEEFARTIPASALAACSTCTHQFTARDATARLTTVMFSSGSSCAHCNLLVCTTCNVAFLKRGAEWLMGSADQCYVCCANKRIRLIEMPAEADAAPTATDKRGSSAAEAPAPAQSPSTSSGSRKRKRPSHLDSSSSSGSSSDSSDESANNEPPAKKPATASSHAKAKTPPSKAACPAGAPAKSALADAVASVAAANTAQAQPAFANKSVLPPIYSRISAPPAPAAKVTTYGKQGRAH